jgi:hypothetical protein
MLFWWECTLQLHEGYTEIIWLLRWEGQTLFILAWSPHNWSGGGLTHQEHINITFWHHYCSSTLWVAIMEQTYVVADHNPKFMLLKHKPEFVYSTPTFFHPKVIRILSYKCSYQRFSFLPFTFCICICFFYPKVIRGLSYKCSYQRFSSLPLIFCFCI